MKRTILPHDFVPYYPVGIYPCEMYVDVANRIYDRIKNFSIDLPYEHKLKKLPLTLLSIMRIKCQI